LCITRTFGKAKYRGEVNIEENYEKLYCDDVDWTRVTSAESVKK